MARPTIAALQAELAASKARVFELESKLSDALKELHAYQVAERPSRQARPQAQPSTGVISFKERCAKARELAMRTGRCVGLQ